MVLIGVWVELRFWVELRLWVGISVWGELRLRGGVMLMVWVDVCVIVRVRERNVGWDMIWKRDKIRVRNVGRKRQSISESSCI